MDIVERLRDVFSGNALKDIADQTQMYIKERYEAADEIERLREQERKMTNHALDRMQEIERLRDALKWIAECEGGDIFDLWKEMRDTARSALQQKESK